MSLTQPWATLLAGVFALVAATIAYRGVLRNIRAQQEAEERTRLVEHLVEAITAVDATLLRVLDYPNGKGRSPDDVNELTSPLYIAAAKLDLFELNDAADAVSTLAHEVADFVGSEPGTAKTSRDDLGPARNSAVDALINARRTVEGRPAKLHERLWMWIRDLPVVVRGN